MVVRERLSIRLVQMVNSLGCFICELLATWHCHWYIFEKLHAAVFLVASSTYARYKNPSRPQASPRLYFFSPTQSPYILQHSTSVIMGFFHHDSEESKAHDTVRLLHKT